MTDTATRPPTNTKRIQALEDQVAALIVQVQVLSSPLNNMQPPAASNGAPTPPRAQRAGLQRPTCVNHRRCGNRSEGVPLAEAIGWMCDPCKGV